MQLHLTYSLTDAAPVSVTTTPWCIMLWERRYKTKASKISDDGLGLEDLTYLAWEASKMAGITVPISFDGFAQQLATIEVVDGDAARPTSAAVSDG